MSNFQKPRPTQPQQRLNELRQYPAIGGDERDFRAATSEMPTERSWNATGQPHVSRNVSDQNTSLMDEMRQFQLSQQEEQNIEQGRKERAKEQPLPREKKTRVEYLIGIGRMTRDFSFGGTTFTLRTLKTKEQKEVFLSIVDANNIVDQNYGLKYHALARSLFRIDDTPIELVYPCKNIEEKILLLEDMDDGLTDKLYREYLELKKSSDEAYAVRSDADVEEVNALLKKA